MMPWRWYVALVIGVAVYYVAAMLLTSDLHEYADLRHHVDYSVGAHLPFRVAYQPDSGWKLVLLVWAFAAWLGYCGYKLADALRASPVSRFAPIGVGFAVLAIMLTFVPFTFSGDPYVYVIFGHVYGLHGINPYLLLQPLQIHGDPVLDRSLAFYGNPPPGDNYGPLWTFICAALARVEANASLGVQLWSYRFLAAASMLIAAAGLFRLISKSQVTGAISRVALFAYHPLVLYESAVGAHNDATMMAFAVWAFALVDDFPLFAGLLIGASIAVKFVSIIALPFLALRAARKSRISGALVLVLALVVFGLCFRPFWAGTATLFELVRHGGIFAMSPTWLVNVPFFARGLGNSPAFGGAVSLPFLGQPSWPRLVQLIAFCAFLIVALFSLFRYARSFASAEIWRSVTAFLWASPIIQPWYLMWLAPAVADQGPWSVFAWWFAGLAFLRYALDGWSLTPLPALVVLTLVMLLAPIVAARQGAPRSQAAAGAVT